MRRILRKLRGALGMAVTWGASWALIGVGLTLVAAIVDPSDIGPGEGPLNIGVLFGVTGAISGFAFGLVMSLAERQRSIGELSMGRAAVWGVLGAAAIPLLTTMNNSLLLLVCPLGAAFAAGSVALARRPLRLEAESNGVFALPDGDNMISSEPAPERVRRDV